MKPIAIILCILVTVVTANTIDAQIEAIRNAPVAKRFKLMNEFKRKIVKMQERERIEAIRKLKTVTKSQYTSRAIKEITQHSQTQQKHTRHRTTHLKNDKALSDRAERQISNQIDDHIEAQIGEHVEQSIENDVENETEDEHHDD